MAKSKKSKPKSKSRSRSRSGSRLRLYIAVLLIVIVIVFFMMKNCLPPFQCKKSPPTPTPTPPNYTPVSYSNKTIHIPKPTPTPTPAKTCPSTPPCQQPCVPDGHGGCKKCRGKGDSCGCEKLTRCWVCSDQLKPSGGCCKGLVCRFNTRLKKGECVTPVTACYDCYWPGVCNN